MVECVARLAVELVVYALLPLTVARVDKRLALSAVVAVVFIGLYRLLKLLKHPVVIFKAVALFIIRA